MTVMHIHDSCATCQTSMASLTERLNLPVVLCVQACPFCTFINRPTAVQCEMCQNHPGVEAAIVQLNDDETRGVMVVL